MKRLYLLLFLALTPILVRAEVFQVEDIRIEGLQRVSAGTVFSTMPVNVGDLMDQNAVRQTTRALFRTGYFDDIKIARDGGVLILVLTERPAIAEIVLEGNKAISTDDLMSALRNNGLAEGQIFRESILEGMVQELGRQYVAQGRYGAKVETAVNTLPRNRISVNITVDEGDVATIKHINIVGNNSFEDGELLDEFELKTTGWLSWIFSDDKYSKEKLSGDLELLESWYLDRGYLKFSVDSTQVAISPDKETVYVTVNVSEGDVYKVSEIDFAGDLIISEEEMRRLVVLKERENFSQVLMTQTNEFMTQRLGNEGYTFAEVKGYPEIDETEKTAKVTFFVNPGKRAYVRRIEFRGNTKTMDEVLRREMRQMEGASASSALIERSKQRLDRLGFFKGVEVETRPVAGTSDQVDVFYTVEEQPSGSIGASVGFAQGFGLILGANLQENNFLGTGDRVGIGLNRSRFRTNISLNYTDPYFTKDGVSAGFNIFGRATDFEEFNVSSYTSDSFGATTNYSYPLSETQRIGFGVGYENLEIDIGTFAADEIRQFVTENGESYNIFTVNFNWVQSSLNRGIFATRGSQQRVSAELAVPGSDAEYFRLNYSAQYFRPLTKSLTLRLQTELGYGDSFGGTSRLPFFKNFYGGGFGSVRGFEKNSLGPRDTPACRDGSSQTTNPGCTPVDDPDPFGGNILVQGGAEILFPVPFIKDQRSVQASLFLDAGNVFDTDCGNKSIDFCAEPDLGELRYSVGVGGTWLSGFGPITVSIAKGLNAGDEDELEIFQFSLGQTF